MLRCSHLHLALLKDLCLSLVRRIGLVYTLIASKPMQHANVARFGRTTLLVLLDKRSH